MQRRNFLRKSAAVGGIGLVGFTSQAAADVSVDVIIENERTDKVEYDISFKNSGLQDISGEIQGSGAENHHYNEYIKFDRVDLKGTSTGGWRFPLPVVRVQGDHSIAHGTCVVESLWKNNQYEIDFLHDVHWTDDNEYPDNESGSDCSGGVNEGKTDTWDFEGHPTRIQGLGGGGYGLNRFSFTYE